VSLNGLAEQFKIHRSTVLDYLNRVGGQQRRPALMPDQIVIAARLYQGGQSLKEVGLRFGVHASTVRAALLKHGIKMRDCQGRVR
jgi:DNA-binding CsgD family transcriptional regulator